MYQVMYSTSLPGKDILTYLQVIWKKSQFSWLIVLACLNSFGVKAVLKHKVINLVPLFFYCSAEEILQRQFIEEAVHQFMLWIVFLQCRKPVYLFINDSSDSISCRTVRQRQPADSQALRPAHFLAAKSCPHNLGPRQKSGRIQPLHCQVNL